MTRSSFLVAFKLSMVSLLLLLKGDFSKCLGELAFWNVLCACWTELQNPDVSATSLKSDFAADDLKPILKFSKQGNEIFAIESAFELVGEGGGIGQLQFFKRNTTKDDFVIIFQNFLNSSFSNIS